MNLINELVVRKKALEQDRASWESDWRFMARMFLPRKFRALEVDGDNTNRGDIRTDVLNNAAMRAMRTLGAGMHGGMTSPARPWFRLTLQDEDLAAYKPVREWLDDCQDRMRNLFHRSNFYNAVHAGYLQIGTFGTEFMFELFSQSTGIRFIPLSIGEYFLDTNENGTVDTVFRTCSMTVRQIVRRFGYDKCPKVVQELFDRNNAAIIDRFQVVHAVYPRNDRNPNKVDPKNMPWASYYFMESGGEKKRLNAPFLLSEGGFRSFPGFGARWDVTGNDVYGQGPGEMVVGDVGQINAMTKTMLKALQKQVDPPMAKPGSTKDVSLVPGGMSDYDAAAQNGGKTPIYPLINIQPATRETREVIAGIEVAIQEGLYNDLFKMILASDRRQVTAREIAAKEEEKLILIGPVLERLHDEKFIPLIERTWELMDEHNMLLPAPEEIQGREIKVEFISLLAQAQKLVSTTAVDQYMAFVRNNMGINPEILDTVNIDKMADGYAGYIGLETDMLTSQDERDAKREARARQQAQAQAQQQLQSLQAGAQTIKTLSESRGKDGSSPLDELIGNLGQGMGTAQ